MIRFALFTSGLLLFAHSAFAACSGSSPSYTAASASSTDVNACIALATTGDTVHFSGFGTWASGSVSLTKAITLDGGSEASTTVDVTGTPGTTTFTITKQAAGLIRLSNITFAIANTASQTTHAIEIDGPWLSALPVIFSHVTFNLADAGGPGIRTNGGVIFSYVTMNAGGTGVNNFLFTAKLVDGASWAAADSIGMNDTDGTKNIYIENSTFNGGTNGVWDCDDGCRIVDRHNTYIQSGGFNSHGWDTSPYGMRQFEIYDNTYSFTPPTDPTCSDHEAIVSNINQFIWIRGATGVIWGNSFDDIASMCWGVKPEIRLSIRGVEDVRTQGPWPFGTCMDVSYPVPHALGQNYTGVTEFTDPIYLWNNSGPYSAASGFSWGNPCGFDWQTFFVSGRDFVLTGVNLITVDSVSTIFDGAGGTPKPGYTPYTYPHPLVSASSSILSVLPASGTLGQAVSVAIVGLNTAWVNGKTTAIFAGVGITVSSTTVLSPTSATVSITISGSATPGPGDVVMVTVP